MTGTDVMDTQVHIRDAQFDLCACLWTVAYISYPEKTVFTLGHGLQEERLHDGVKRDGLTTRVQREVVLQLHGWSDTYRTR